MKVKTGYAPRERHCDCGGSGWIPGIPDDEPCPHHAERDSSLSSPPLRSGSLSIERLYAELEPEYRDYNAGYAAGRLAGLREALEILYSAGGSVPDPDLIEARIAELERV